MPTDLPGVLIFFGKAFIIQNVGGNERKQIFDKAKKGIKKERLYAVYAFLHPLYMGAKGFRRGNRVSISEQRRGTSIKASSYKITNNNNTVLAAA